MYSKRNQDDIPIKIGGWDGKFVYEKPKLKEGYELVKPTRGTLDRQQWQQGKKEIINVKHQSGTHHEETTTHTKTSTHADEHYVRVESQEDQHHDEQYAEHHDEQYAEHQRQQQQQYQKQQQYYNPSEPNPQFANERDYNQAKQTVLDAGQLHGYTTDTEVLPAQWDGKYPEGYRNYRPNPQINQSNANNLHGFNTEPTILPAQWDGKFPEGYRNYRPKPDQNRSNATNLYGYDNSPTILPVQWDGKFAKSGETYTVPDRNSSQTNDYYGYDKTPTVLPTVWNGKFQLDPNDVRIKPERNASDMRDYADHRRFVTRE